MFTPSGLVEYPVLAGARCEETSILVESQRFHNGIPCYPLIVECSEDGFRYSVLENYGRIKVIPMYTLKSSEGERVVVERVDGTLFKVADPTLAYLLKYMQGRNVVEFYTILEDLVALESLAGGVEYTEDMVETTAIRLGILIGFLAYEAELVGVQVM